MTTMTQTEKAYQNATQTGALLRQSQKVHKDATYKLLDEIKEAIKDNDILTDENFWKAIKHFRELIIKKFYRNDPVESAIFELMRLINEGSPVFKDLKDVCEFIVKYRNVSAKLSHELYKIDDLNRSDDGISDLSDMLPLAGKKVFQLLMIDAETDEEHLKTIKNDDKLELHVKDSVKYEKMTNMIMNGENYVATKLEEELQRRLTYK
jgi:hypothetical protein